MSATLGGAWAEEQPSSERMNAKSWFVGTGDEIADIPVTSSIPCALCTEDGSGFLANHAYIRHYDDEFQIWSGWDDIFRKHTHSEDTETAGGDYVDIDIANAETRFSLTRHSLYEENFLIENGSTGATATVMWSTGAGTAESQWLRLNTTTGGSAGSPKYVQLQDGGVRLSLSDKIEWHIKFQEGPTGTNGTTGILWRMGVGMERVHENSETTLQKFGIEGCDGDGVPIQLVSCSGSGGGSNRIKTNTTVAMNQTAAIGVKVSYVPSTSVIYTDSIGTVKSSPGGFPSSGAVQSNKTLRYGIKATNTNAKTLDIWADALYGKINDVSWI